MIFRRALVVTLSVMSSASIGCRMSAPIHVWQPPALESTVGRRIAVAEVVGPDKTADAIHTGVVAQAPSDHGRKTTLVDSRELQDKTQIQLVSAIDDQPSDIALSAVARREGFDYLLSGEVLQPSAAGRDEQNRRLTVSWRLLSLGDQRSVGGKPVVVDVETAKQVYPDLNMLSDAQEVLTTAAIRDTYRLITPHVRRDRVQLAIPYGLPGSKRVREGNIAALSGQWGKARQIWREVSEQHPTQVAAIHNLAVAEAAAQNFSRAKELGRRAVRWQPTRLHQETLVWIELRQRDYHASFNLPEPPEGWFVTQ